MFSFDKNQDGTVKLINLNITKILSILDGIFISYLSIFQAFFTRVLNLKK